MRTFKDRGSLDRISLDRISWSKFSNKIGVWSKLCFITWSKFEINHINILSLDRMFWQFSVDRNFKITQNDINKSFDQLPKSISSFLAVDRNFLKAQNSIIRTFDQVPKKNLRILALDRMYCWLRNRAKN